MTSKYTNQVGFRGRQTDSVGLNVDGGWATGTNQNWNQEVDTVFRVRLEYQEENNKVNNQAAQLEINYSGTWANVSTTSGPIIATGSAQFSDDDVTTDVLAVGAGTFVGGYGSHDGLTPSISLQNTHTEVEYSLSINKNVVNNNDTIQLRVAGLDAWAVTPTITVVKAAAPPTIVCNSGNLTLAGQQATLQVGEVTISCQAGNLALAGQSVTVSAGGGIGQIAYLDWEEGDFSDATSTDNQTDLAVNGTAALVGSYGLSVYQDGSLATTRINRDMTVSTNVLRFRFYIDINSLSMGLTDNFVLVNLHADGTYNSQVNFFLLRLGWNTVDYDFAMNVYDDTNTNNASADWNTSDGIHYIEVRIVRESSDGANDGSATLWIDGSLQETVSSIDNYNIFPTMDELRWGAVSSLDATTSGTIYLDDFIIRDDDTEIGSATSNVTISCQSGNLTLSGQSATVKTDIYISCNTGNLVLSGQQVTLQTGEATIGCQSGNLTLSGQSVTLVAGTAVIECQTGNLVLSGQQATIIGGATSVSCNVGNLVLSGQSATLSIGATIISCQTGNLTLSGQSATLIAGEATLTLSAGQLTFTGQQATVNTTGGPQTISCQSGNLVLSGQTATLAAGEVTILAQSGNLTLSGQSATLVTGETTITCSSGNLVLSGQAVTLVPGNTSISCTNGTLTLSGQQATIQSLAAGIIGCQAGTLSLSGQSATTIAGEATISCEAGNLVLSGQSITITGAVAVLCNNGTLTLSGQSASVIAGETSITCNYGTLTLSGLQASITAIAGTVISCGYGTLILSGQSTTVIVGEAILACNTGNLTLSGQAATINTTIAGVTITTDYGLLTLSGNSVSVVPGATTITTDYGLLTFSGLDASLVGEILYPKGAVTISDSLMYNLTINDSLFSSIAEDIDENTEVSIEDS